MTASCVHLLVVFLLLLHLLTSSFVTLHVNNNTNLNIASICNIQFQIDNEILLFNPHSLLSFTTTHPIQLQQTRILFTHCHPIQLSLTLAIGHTHHTLTAHCPYQCCLYNPHKNESKNCSPHSHTRSLLSPNTTNPPTPLPTSVTTHSSFFGRKFYGIPISAYFILLFALVCIVWVCVVCALCIGYRKRNRRLQSKAALMRSKIRTKKTNTNTNGHTHTQPTHTHTKPKPYHTHTKYTVPKVKRVTKPPKTVKKAPKKVKTAPKRVKTPTKSPTNTTEHMSENTENTENTETQPMKAPSLNLTNTTDNSHIKVPQKKVKKHVILPTNTVFRKRESSQKKIEVKNRRDLQLVSVPHSMNSGTQSTLRSHVSDNDIILQMEQDWASENGTQIFDSNASINELKASLSIHSNIFNKVRGSGVFDTKGIPIVFAKKIGLTPINQSQATMDESELSSSTDESEISESKESSSSHSPPIYYNENLGGKPKRDNGRTHKQELESFYNESIADDSNMRYSDFNNYKTTNHKNPFAKDNEYYPSLQEQISMQHSFTQTTMTDESLRFPNELMQFSDKSKHKNAPKHMHITVESDKNGKLRTNKSPNRSPKPYIDDGTTVSTVSNNREQYHQTMVKTNQDIQTLQISKNDKQMSNNSLGIDRLSNGQKNHSPLFSPISVTPQPIPAPLSPTTMSNTMPIKPLRNNVKSPFRLPPLAISLQQIQPSNSPPLEGKKRHNTAQSMDVKSGSVLKQSGQLHGTGFSSLDGGDLYQKLSQISKGKSEVSSNESYYSSTRTDSEYSGQSESNLVKGRD